MLFKMLLKAGLHIGILLLVETTLIVQAARIISILIRTTDCWTCGMGPFGSLRLQVCKTFERYLVNSLVVTFDNII